MDVDIYVSIVLGTILSLIITFDLMSRCVHKVDGMWMPRKGFSGYKVIGQILKGIWDTFVFKVLLVIW